MNEIQAYAAANRLFIDYVNEVKTGQGRLPTPDSDWSVHDLVNHVVGEDLWLPPLLDGKTIAEVGDQYDGDVLGNNPAAAARTAAELATAAAEAVTDFDKIVHLSFGDVPAREYLQQMTIDHVIHSWDLARAIGADTHLPPELVEIVSDWLLPQADSWRSAGLFGPAVELSGDADAQDRLIAITGRDPR